MIVQTKGILMVRKKRINLFVYHAFRGNNVFPFQLIYYFAKIYGDEYDIVVYSVKKNLNEFRVGTEDYGFMKVQYNPRIYNYVRMPRGKYATPIFTLLSRMFLKSDIAIVQYPHPLITIPFITARSRTKIFCRTDIEGHYLFVGRKGVVQKIKLLFENSMDRFADVFTTYTDYAKGLLEEKYSKPVFILSHGYHGDFRNVDETQVQRLREQLNLVGKKVVIFTGSVTPTTRTDFDLLYHGIKKIARKRHDIVLLTIGADMRADDACVLNLPRQPYEKMPLYLSLADLTVLPKRDNELQRWCIHVVKLVEAMVVGLPVITPPIGLAAMIPRNCFYPIEPGSADDIANAILHLCDDNRLRTDIIENARRYAKQNLGWEVIARKLHDILVMEH